MLSGDTSGKKKWGRSGSVVECLTRDGRALGSSLTDPDPDRHSVGPDLGPNCLQRLSADDKSRCEELRDFFLDYSIFF